MRRRIRAFTGWGILVALTFTVHIWAYFYQRTYTRVSIPDDAQKMDIHDPRYPAHVWLMIFYGLLDSMWQTCAMWLIGAMSNDANKLGVFSGFYHSIQSAGAAIVWRLDAIDTPYMNIFISTWCIVAAGLAFALPMIHLRVKDHTTFEDEALMKQDQVEPAKVKEPIAED